MAFIAGGVVLLAAAGVVLIILDKPLAKNAAQKFLFRKTGVALTIGRLDYRLFPLSVEATAVKVSYATPVFSLEIAADRVGLKGDFLKVLRGETPALDTTEAEIVEVRVNQAKSSPEPIDVQALLLQLANTLSFSRHTSLRCERLVALLLSQDFRLDNTSLTVTGGRAGGDFDIALGCEKLAGVMNQGKLSFGSGLDADGVLSLSRTAGLDFRLAMAKPHVDVAGRAAAADDLTVGVKGTWQPDNRTAGIDLNLALAKPRADIAGKSAAVDRLTIDLQGTWQPDKMIIRIPKLAFDVPDLVSVAGDLSFSRAGDRSFEAGVKAQFMDLEAFGRDASPFLPPAFRAVRLKGKAGLEAKYTLGPRQGGKPGELSAKLGTQGMAWEYKNGGPPVSGRLSGTIEAKGLPADPQLSGDVRLETGHLSGMGAVARTTSAHIMFAGSKADANMAVPAATLNGVSLAVPGGKTLVFEKIDLAGNAGVRLGAGPAVDAHLEARLPGLAPVRVAGRFGLRPWRLQHASLDSTGQEIAALRGLLTPFLPPAVARWDAGGTVDVSLQVDKAGRAKEPVRLRADIALSGGKFNDPEFTVASDRLRTHISFAGNYGVENLEIGGKATLELLQGESLWKRFYVSWDKTSLQAEISGRYNPTTRSLEGLSAAVSVPGLGELHAAGRLVFTAPLTFSFQTSARFDLEPALSIFSENKPSSPGRPEIKGDASSDIEIGRTAGGLTLKGRLTIGNVSVVNASSGFSIPGLSADLPLDFALPGPPASAAAGAPAETGTIRIGEVRASHLTLEVPTLTVSSLINAYELAPFALEIFGGRLEIGKTSLAVTTEPLSFQGASSLRLTGIDLSGLPFVPAGSPLRGTVRADFPALDITPGKVSAAGQAEADVFGGQVVVTKLAITDPFARDREIACDVEFRDLDLKKITDLVPFGEVTGIIRGEARDLAIAYGQPEQFDLTLESVDKKGVPRTFSLKAVNSLTVITAGQPATPGTSSSFWLRFIKGFRYDRIGIRSTLKNDMFTIDGMINENGVAYLVKRPALSGISVINRNPGKTIGFKDMMSRLERVGESGAPDSKK